MRYEQDLQVQLRDRLARLLKIDYDEAAAQVKFTVNWIRKQSALVSILTNAEQAEQGLAADFESWKQSVAQGQPAATETEAGRAWLVWKLLEEVADESRTGDTDPVRSYIMGYYRRNSGVTDAVRKLFLRVVAPMFDYLSDQVGQAASMLYLLQRYVRRLEWFERDDLYARYEAASGQKGEEVYDIAFRRFLFDEGVSMPFSQVKSPSGLADAVVDEGDSERFVGEIKLFDGENRRKRELAKGFNQAIQYAQDWGSSTSYLVIVNLSGRTLELPSEGSVDSWPSYLDVGGIRVYMVVARALPRESASKQGKVQPVVVTREDLLDPDTGD